MTKIDIIEVRPNGRVVANSVGEETILLHLDTGYYFSLNEIGSGLWEGLTSGKAMRMILDELHAVYDVEMSRLESDVNTLVTELLTNDIVEVV